MPEPFKSLTELAAYVQKKYIADAMINEVSTTVKKTESEAIKDTVYVYEPKDYIRRFTVGQDGLNSPENMEAVLSPDGSILSVTNTTHGYMKENVNVAGLVEYGQENKQGYGVYDWSPPDDREPLYLEPRQYVEETVRRLNEGDLVKKALIKGLERQNLNVK